ncbi:MAG: hypothetical protein LLF94_10890 [Chlamydiales bacterium]|nr:hypothetical protein [Chlamydiales bacterium]
MENARNFANEAYLNADGFIDDDLQFTANEDFFSADGLPMNNGASVPTSQPYIITVSNSTAGSVSNFDVLGAYEYLQNVGFSGGSLTVSGVTISSGLSNITYQQFLYQSMNSPFSVGMTYIQSIAGSSSQITQPLTLNTRDANGNQALKTLVVTIDPYQQQNGVVAVKQLYRIDGFTKITISNVLPSAVFQMQFYPSDNINLARGLAGRPASRQFGNPNIVKSSVAVVGGETVKARLG